MITTVLFHTHYLQVPEDQKSIRGNRVLSNYSQAYSTSLSRRETRHNHVHAILYHEHETVDTNQRISIRSHRDPDHDSPKYKHPDHRRETQEHHTISKTEHRNHPPTVHSVDRNRSRLKDATSTRGGPDIFLSFLYAM